MILSSPTCAELGPDLKTILSPFSHPVLHHVQRLVRSVTRAGVCFHQRCPCETPRHSESSAISAAKGSGFPSLSASRAARKLIDHGDPSDPWYGFVTGNTDPPCPTVIDPTPPGGTSALTTHTPWPSGFAYVVVDRSPSGQMIFTNTCASRTARPDASWSFHAIATRVPGGPG